MGNFLYTLCGVFLAQLIMAAAMAAIVLVVLCGTVLGVVGVIVYETERPLIRYSAPARPPTDR